MAKFIEGEETCQVVSEAGTYDINFQEGRQVNVRTNKERKIRCMFGLPDHWNTTDVDDLNVLKSGAGTDTVLHPVTNLDVLNKLQDVLNKSLFRHSGERCDCFHGRSKFVVLQAYQIKNVYLWRRYQRFVKSLADKQRLHKISADSIAPCVGDALTNLAIELGVDLAGNQRLLLHGTHSMEIARKIACEGFDNRVARDGGFYGKGTYFAAQTCKSAQYAHPLGLREKATMQIPGSMVIARVAIGDPFYTQSKCQELTRTVTSIKFWFRFRIIFFRHPPPCKTLNGVKQVLFPVLWRPRSSGEEWFPSWFHHC